MLHLLHARLATAGSKSRAVERGYGTLTRALPPSTPERFGHYELVARLGVGGMAETFLAIRRGIGGFEQRVCLKRILPTFAGEADFVAMFRREARLSALLHQGHIARVLDFGIAKATNLPGSIQSGALKGKVPYIN
ncbi:MAG: hypothetical protein WBB42_08345 [Polyangiales bacterium]